MKLLVLKVGGFGPLKGEYRFDPAKLTLLVDDNERGKSSLLAAITAALYGLEDDRRSHRVMTPLERWRPWNGGAFRVELEIECANERYNIVRDFDKGAVQVWSGNGKDVTEKFSAGKDDYPVGKILLGLDSEEFEKCALVRQGEMDSVVPDDEKVRRQSTLHARLENAADTKGGDTNAVEALQVLEAAAASYTCDELGTTLKIETAIQRLDAQRGLLESELHALEHDLQAVAAPLEQLGKLGDEENAMRATLATLDSQRGEAIVAEARRRLDENDIRCREVQKLKDEAVALGKASKLPPNAEAELRETVARFEAAKGNLDTLEQRRHDQQVKERQRIETELDNLKTYSGCTTDEADRFIGLASELRRVTDEDARLRDDAFSRRDSLAGKGHMPDRIQFLTGRFGELTEEQQRVIRGQNDLALAFQTEVAQLESARTDATETLREIDAERHGRKIPGWALTAIGFSTAGAGITLMALQTQPTLWVGMMVAGAVAAAIGLPLLIAGTSARTADRETALKRLADAQRRLNQMRNQRAESEVAISELSRGLGYRDSVELMRDWIEYSRLMDESVPVMRAQQQITTLREQRTAALAEIKVLLEKVGGGPSEPAHLERVAQGIRLYAAGQKQLAEIDRGWGWIDEEKRVAESTVTALSERAQRILAEAEIKYDASKPWSEHVERLAELSRGGSRHTMLVNELIPAAEKRTMPEKEEKALRRELEMMQAEGVAEGTVSARPQAELEADTRTTREKLDHLLQSREDLRSQVDAVSRRYHAEHPTKSTELEKINVALERARRFERAVLLARETIQTVAVETHRRWADWLNQRVAELLSSIGAKIEQLRFGEDLDFSVKLDSGQQATRGRAVTQLSAGARDQLHLAVRLAVSEYLSRGSSPLPLLLDDAFSTSDDERTRAGMNLLIEHFSKQHQIILVTCHRQRYEALAERDKPLYASRVHWLNGQTAAKS